MKFETKFEVLQLADLVTPPYNPRVDMEPDSPEYKALRRSLEQHQLVEPFVEKYQDENDFLLIDNAPAMVDACRKRFAAVPGVLVKAGNLWEYLPLPDKASLVLSVLSLQFMPTSYRQKMLSDIYEGLTPGGALILVEKIVSESLDELMVHLYYEMKRENGYTDDQIMDKRRSLENVLSPLKVGWNVDMLRTAGFKQVAMFWRCLNFCGWIAVK